MNSRRAVATKSASYSRRRQAKSMVHQCTSPNLLPLARESLVETAAPRKRSSSKALQDLPPPAKAVALFWPEPEPTPWDQKGSATKLAHACPLFSILSSPGAASWLEYARKLLVSGQEGGGYKFQGPQPSSRKLTFRSSTASNICPVTTRAGQVAALLQTFPPMF